MGYNPHECVVCHETREMNDSDFYDDMEGRYIGGVCRGCRGIATVLYHAVPHTEGEQGCSGCQRVHRRDVLWALLMRVAFAEEHVPGRDLLENKGRRKK